MKEISIHSSASKLTNIYHRQAVIKEAMRLHPSKCYPLERVVPPEGATVCNVDLPGGTIIVTTAPLVNCNESIFGADAKEFNPERWLENSAERLKVMDRTYFTVRSDLS